MKTIAKLSMILALALTIQAFSSAEPKAVQPQAESSASSELCCANASASVFAGSAASQVLVSVPSQFNELVTGTTPESSEKGVVPPSPFNLGDPEEEAPAELARIKAVNADVPLAPFEMGDPDFLPLIVEKI